jgi:hypothetical protein
MGHHAKSGGCATPGAIKIALDSSIINLLLIGGMLIHRHLPLKKPIVLMRIIEALLVYFDITSVTSAQQYEALLKWAVALRFSSMNFSTKSTAIT